MILNINTVVALMNHMENMLVTLIPLFALMVVFFIVPLAIATIISTIETITLKEYLDRYLRVSIFLNRTLVTSDPIQIVVTYMCFVKMKRIYT